MIEKILLVSPFLAIDKLLWQSSLLCYYLRCVVIKEWRIFRDVERSCNEIWDGVRLHASSLASM